MPLGRLASRSIHAWHVSLPVHFHKDCGHAKMVSRAIEWRKGDREYRT